MSAFEISELVPGDLFSLFTKKLKDVGLYYIGLSTDKVHNNFEVPYLELY